MRDCLNSQYNTNTYILFRYKINNTALGAEGGSHSSYQSKARNGARQNMQQKEEHSRKGNSMQPWGSR